MPLALHSHPGPLTLTYYPAMPGNSTAKPGEKWVHQRQHMAPGAAVSAFEGAVAVECQATTLAAFAREQGLRAIDLLKVRASEGKEGMLPFTGGAWWVEPADRHCSTDVGLRQESRGLLKPAEP